MTDPTIVNQLPLWPDSCLPPKKPKRKPNLHTFWQHPERWPAGVSASLTVQRGLDLLGPLDWDNFPERNLDRNWGQTTIPFSTLAASELLSLDEGLTSIERLHRHLLEHPGFIALLGFPLRPAPNHPLGFNALASLPTARHLTQMLRDLPNAALQFLLANTVQLILAELATLGLPPIECVSLDTKHILAWVKENNPKTYVPDRFNKNKQPVGDPDCKLGCKRRHNQVVTPTHNSVSPTTIKVGEYHWGYGSGVVVTKVPDWGEFVLAEMTQPFDQGDLSYFFPLTPAPPPGACAPSRTTFGV